MTKRFSGIRILIFLFFAALIVPINGATAQELSCDKAFLVAPLYGYRPKLGHASKRELIKAGLIHLSPLAGPGYSLIARSVFLQAQKKCDGRCEKVPQLQQFLNHFLTELMYSSNWTKEKAQLGILSVEYVVGYSQHLSKRSSGVLLNQLLRTLINGSPQTQARMVSRLHAINEGMLRYNDLEIY